ncbi:MAG: dienelactone hydrolase family protein [Candidatus Methylomirabilales bacterium]
MGEEGQAVSFSSGPDRVQGYLARPAGGGPFPALVLIHEIHGLTDHFRDLARRFAAEGYVGCVLDLYSREGPPQPQALRDAAARNAFVASLPDRRLVADVQAAAAFLRTLPEVRRDRVGVVGFCMGGTVTLLSACHTPGLAAAVVFYGGRLVYQEITENKPASPLDLVGHIRCPMLCLYGGADASVPLPDIERLRDTLEKHRKTFEFKIYPGAPHAFFNDAREFYRPDEARDAWQRTLRFLEKHLRH